MGFIRNIIKKELPFVFASPALVAQMFFLYMPLVVIFIASFSLVQDPTKWSISWTLEHYREVIAPIYLKIIFSSMILASIVSFICLIIAYPVAYFLAIKVKKFRTLFLFALILPSWSNFIVQIYSWFFLLEKGGFFSKLLFKIGLFDRCPNLLNNYFATVIGMVYCFLPFMIFPIYTVLEKMDKRLLEASADLGASRFLTFRRVIFPLSRPGVLAGFLLVFVPAFGEFAIPILLGGSKNVFWGNVIVQKLFIAKNWGSGFALAVLGVGILISFFLAIFISSKIYKNLKSHVDEKLQGETEASSFQSYWDENG